jgi:hypothetical protein
MPWPGRPVADTIEDVSLATPLRWAADQAATIPFLGEMPGSSVILQPANQRTMLCTRPTACAACDGQMHCQQVGPRVSAFPRPAAG